MPKSEEYIKDEYTFMFVGDYLVRVNAMEEFLDSCIGLGIGLQKEPQLKFFIENICNKISLGKKVQMVVEIIEYNKFSNFSHLGKKLERIVKIRNQLAHGHDIIPKSLSHNSKDGEIVQISFTNKNGKTVTESYNFVKEINDELMPTVKTIFELREHLRI